LRQSISKVFTQTGIVSIAITEYSPTTNQSPTSIATIQKYQNEFIQKVIFKNVRDYFNNLKKLFHNLKCILVILSMATEGVLLKGFLGFVTKYFEYQFKISASTSSIITALIALISVIGGTLMGALLINRNNWKVKECSIFCTTLYLISSFFFFVFLNYCKETEFVCV
jgi:hypothetical protein